MRFQLKVTNTEHVPALDALADEKFAQPVQKLLGGLDVSADIILAVEFERTTNHHRTGAIWRAEAQLDLPSVVSEIRAEATAETLEDAADEVKHKLIREIKTYKSKGRP